ncbi:ATP phosphoribosyltransferase 2, chloroplastic-like protein [Tanacetum coccineum]
MSTTELMVDFAKTVLLLGPWTHHNSSFPKIDGEVKADYYAIVICVPKKLLYKSVQQLRAADGDIVVVNGRNHTNNKEQGIQ